MPDFFVMSGTTVIQTHHHFPEDLNPQTIFIKLLLYCKVWTQRKN